MAGEPPPLYAVRRNQDGHAEAIERDGYTVLLLAIGALRNEEEVERIVEVLNGRRLASPRVRGGAANRMGIIPLCLCRSVGKSRF